MLATDLGQRLARFGLERDIDTLADFRLNDGEHMTLSPSDPRTREFCRSLRPSSLHQVRSWLGPTELAERLPEPSGKAGVSPRFFGRPREGIAATAVEGVAQSTGGLSRMPDVLDEALTAHDQQLLLTTASDHVFAGREVTEQERRILDDFVSRFIDIVVWRFRDIQLNADSKTYVENGQILFARYIQMHHTAQIYAPGRNITIDCQGIRTFG